MKKTLAELLSDLKPHLTNASYANVEQIVNLDNPAVWDLRLARPEDILKPDEIDQLTRCDERPIPSRAGLPPQTVVIVKATRLCNLRCTYCNSWREGPGQVMTFEVLAAVTRDVLQSPSVRNIDFVWHGGEVTLLKPSYLQKAIWLQERYSRDNTVIANSIQTNATRLSPDWIKFIKDFNIGVGVSIDGPPEVHDARRLTIDGQGSWKDVKKGIDRLRDAGIRFGALSVVDECVIAMGAKEYLQYLVDLGITQVALLNALPPNTEQNVGQAEYLPHDRFAKFLQRLFNVWWNEFHSVLEIRELQSLVDAVAKGSTGLCIFNRRNCMGQYLTIEPEGEVSACDKYVGDTNYVFGNVLKQELNSMLIDSGSLRAAKTDVDQKKSRMEKCEHFRVCFGGCPHDVRLSDKYLNTRTSDCCGMKDLIDDISLALANTV